MRKGLSPSRLPSLEVLRYRLRYSKRLLVNRRGDGVHSPFAFHFISKVVRNRRPFYCFDELATEAREARGTYFSSRIRRICELLFRTAHELQIRRILHLGASGEVLQRYLEQTGYTTSWQSYSTADELEDALRTHLEAPDLIIIEDPLMLPVLCPYLESWLAVSAQVTVAGYTLGRSAYRHWEGFQSVVPARLQLDLLDIQLAFYDERLTASAYKGVY